MSNWKVVEVAGKPVTGTWLVDTQTWYIAREWAMTYFRVSQDDIKLEQYEGDTKGAFFIRKADGWVSAFKEDGKALDEKAVAALFSKAQKSTR